MSRIEVKILNKNNIFMFIHKCAFHHTLKKWFLLIVIENNINLKILSINSNKYIPSWFLFARFHYLCVASAIIDCIIVGHSYLEWICLRLVSLHAPAIASMVLFDWRPEGPIIIGTGSFLLCWPCTSWPQLGNMPIATSLGPGRT